MTPVDHGSFRPGFDAYMKSAPKPKVFCVVAVDVDNEVINVAGPFTGESAESDATAWAKMGEDEMTAYMNETGVSNEELTEYDAEGWRRDPEGWLINDYQCRWFQVRELQAP